MARGSAQLEVDDILDAFYPKGFDLSRLKCVEARSHGLRTLEGDSPSGVWAAYPHGSPLALSPRGSAA
jgi:hypothetical protein